MRSNATPSSQLARSDAAQTSQNSNHAFVIQQTQEEIINEESLYSAPASPTSPAAQNILVVNNENSREPFLAPITLDGLKFLALIDTGAAISIINKDITDLLEIATSPINGTLQLAEKDAKVPRYQIVSPIKLTCGNHSLNIRPDVLNLPDNTPFILGRDLLAQLGIGITNIPFEFPEEPLSEPDDCLVCDHNNIAKIIPGNEDPSFATNVEAPITRNENLDPLTPCAMPRNGYKLRLKPDASPVFRRQYNLGPCKQEALNETIEKWIQAGVVVRCAEGSPFNSPMITVPKRDESGQKTGIRVCIDPRPINKIIEDDNFVVPLVTDIFARAEGATYFTTIDLKEAYTQIALHKDSQPLTAFTWRGLQYMFTRCIFGIKTMSSMFQRVITNVLESCREFAVAYVDDIVIHSKSKNDHIKHVTAVLEALTNANLRINKAKCRFGMQKVKLLGFLISHDGIIPEQSRLEQIFNFPSPSSSKDLQRFLGMCNYLRAHIPHYTEFANPLDTAKWTSPFTWHEELERAFLAMKSAISKAKLLSTPNDNLPFFLATDASNVGLGSVLYQQDELGNKYYISFDSRSLKPSEKNYHANKKELLALVFGLLKNQHILKGRHFTLFSDHRALMFIHSQRNTNVIIENWLDIIGSFNFTITHLPGIENVIPDALSRAPCPSHNHAQLLAISPSAPAALDLEALHAEGHFQAHQMLAKLKDRGHFWTSMKHDCEEVAKNCLICQRTNPTPPTYNHLQPIDANKPFDHIQIDLVTDLPTSPFEFSHVLDTTDVASKFTILRPLKSKSATEVATQLMDIFSTFGPPKILQSDQGREFDNSLLENICSNFGIDKRLSAAYSPRTNGLVERTNQTWVRILKKLAAFCQSLWPSFLPATQLFLNTRITRPIGVSPFEAMFLRKHNQFKDFSQETLRDTPDDALIIDEIIRAHTQFWPSLTTSSQLNHEKMKRQFDRSNHISSFNVGDIVFVKREQVSKLDPLFDGPFRITRVTSANTYELVNPSNIPFHRRVTTSQLRRAHSQFLPVSSDTFEFEEILDHRGPISDREYFVKWKDYPLSEASWISQHDFSDPSVLKNYWKSREGVMLADHWSIQD